MFHVKHRKVGIMKDITSKQFKEILTNAGVDFKVYGYAGLLNKLCILYDERQELYAQSNDECTRKCADIAHKRSKRIYDQLDALGYYDDVE